MKQPSRYIAFLFNESINDSNFAFSDSKPLVYSTMKWYENIINVIEFEEKDFYNHDLPMVLDIINNYIESYIGIFEEEIIYEDEVKADCLLEFNKFLIKYPNNRFLMPFINLFQIALDKHKNIYLFF